jgi:hypothetical protein
MLSSSFLRQVKFGSSSFYQIEIHESLTRARKETTLFRGNWGDSDVFLRADLGVLEPNRAGGIQTGCYKNSHWLSRK